MTTRPYSSPRRTRPATAPRGAVQASEPFGQALGPPGPDDGLHPAIVEVVVPRSASEDVIDADHAACLDDCRAAAQHARAGLQRMACGA